jgi:hypothetical protein
MSLIPIGRPGKIVAGDEVDCFVKVVDDSKNTGGFLILTASNPDFTDGSDNWVEDESALQRYFRDAKWLVEWLM